ncbi:MAG: cyclic nucleotide-binding domain-containing protein [Magnetococcus sp. MYC-9]
MIDTDKKGALGNKEVDWFVAHGYGLAAMEKPECVDCLEFFNPVSLRGGEFLFTEGEPDDQLFIIREGTVEMGQLSDARRLIDFGPYGRVAFDDEENSTADNWLRSFLLREGECAGEVGFVANKTHRWAAQARSNVELFQVDARNIDRLMGRSRLVCQHLAIALARTHQKIALTC